MIERLNAPDGVLTWLPDRLRGWRGRGADVLARHRRAPFQWGIHDCGILCADWIEAICGVDPLARYRGRYDSQDTARAVLAADGFTDHVELFGLAVRQEHISAAVYGDVAVLEGAGGRTTGPVLGETIAVFDERRGVVNVPLSRGDSVLVVGRK